jgi:hypothetical protein
VLKNTDEVVGVALYCGYDTKILKNQGYFIFYLGKFTIK